MRFFSLLALVVTIFFTINISAQGNERKSETIHEGRVIVNNGKKYLHFEKDGTSLQRLIHNEYTMFSGQRIIWAQGELKKDFLAIKEIISEKNVLIEGHVGQGVHLKGSLKFNPSGQFEFYPTNGEALNALGAKKSFKVRLPEDSLHTLKPTELLSLRGVISGDTLYVSSDFYAVHIIQDKALAQSGDIVMIMAKIGSNDLYQSYDFRNHGISDNYGFFKSIDVGQFEIFDIDEVHLLNPKTGEWTPAKLKTSKPLYANVVQDDDHQVDIYESDSSDTGEIMYFLGELKSDDLMLITDAKVYVEGSEIPAITKEKPKKVAEENNSILAPKVELRIIDGGLRDSNCERVLTDKPKLTLVPKE